MEAIQFASRKGLIREQTRSLWYRLKLWRAAGPMLSQAGNELVYFDAYPEMKAQSLEIASQEIRDIQDTCHKNNIQLLFVLLPTRLDVEEQTRQAAAGSLGLSATRMNLNQELKSLLIDRLAQTGVAYLDLTDYLRDTKEPLFWNQDYHLNDKGHQRVAETLFSRLGPILYSRQPAPRVYR